MERGRVEYVPVRAFSVSIPGSSNLRVSSGKSKKRMISRSPVKRRFEIESPPLSSQQHRVVEDLGFSAALDCQQSCKESRRSGQNRRAAPVFQGGLPWLLLFRLHLENALYRLFAVVYYHLQYEIVLPFFSCLYSYLCERLVQTNKKKRNIG